MSTIAERNFVYAIGREDGPIKVGITQSLLSRLRTLQNGSPHKLDIIWIYTTWDRVVARWMEGNFHAVHADVRLEGEWFDLSAIEAFESLETQVMHMFDESIACLGAGKPICALRLKLERERAKP